MFPMPRLPECPPGTDYTPRWQGDSLRPNAKTIMTHAGDMITARQSKFIDCFLQYGEINLTTAVKEAGYQCKGRFQKGKQLLAMPEIQEEIKYRMSLMQSEKVASIQEVLEYLTRVVRGEEKDAFGLDVGVADRTNAAKELLRRYDVDNKYSSVNGNEIVIKLDWDRNTQSDD